MRLRRRKRVTPLEVAAITEQVPTTGRPQKLPRFHPAHGAGAQYDADAANIFNQVRLGAAPYCEPDAQRHVFVAIPGRCQCEEWATVDRSRSPQDIRVVLDRRLR